jgi:hypothetical protein
MDLRLHRPARKLSCLDSAEQSRLERFAGLSDQRFRFTIGMEFVPLPGLEMEFYPVALARRIDQGIGMASVPVMCIGEIGRPRSDIGWCRLSGDSDQKSQIAVGDRILELLRMDEVRKLISIPDEEHRSVVADHVPVAFVGIKLQRKTAHVALGVRRAELAGNGRIPRQHVRLGAGLQTFRLGVFRDVAGNRQRAERAQPLACTVRSGMRSRCASFSMS